MSDTWRTYRRQEITAAFCERAATLYREGKTDKQVARFMGIPPSMWRAWLEAGENQTIELQTVEGGDEMRMLPEALLWEAVAPAIAERDSSLARKVDDPKWMLERMAPDEFGPAAQRVEVSGPDRGPIAVEGRAVVGLADVVRLALETGQGHLLGLPAGLAGELVPAAADVLPDPPGSEPAAGPLPAPEL